MIPQAWRLLPRNATHSLSTLSTKQRAEDHNRQLEAYGYFLPIQTRWQDNDQYGHVNNAVYYSYFDTIINHYLIRTLETVQKSPRSSSISIKSTQVEWAAKHSLSHFWRTVFDLKGQVCTPVMKFSPLHVGLEGGVLSAKEAYLYCGLKTSLLTSPLVGFMVANQCKYHTPIGFPQIPVAALAVEKVGRSSVCYQLALFPPKPTKEPPSVDHRDLTDGFFLGHPKLAQFDTLACTTGSSVHVFVNPATRKPESLPEDFRNSLQKLMSPA
ncbi:uncharacterized protein LOC101841231 isoform X1 [Mesocricetus auratus]|uniref:Uncharacterized protein LOC101841231 isoform X1 n=1 Tax=Mesocricetus auratus TaxID=10036 RepID=A0A1U8CFE0_MESAU|nr:uncharacterized protein LOC101841231 isoform X1 [Mesocricetus auratus]XP_012978126.1 uncharacterized protein LOC101841231 isoform X1 [Mesocricetus auratus]XP_012978132.1 uncharacterized protein LOC101841231 isoform X1 [Mesocricetus auratus]XP_040601883.1 uncharacterized protein LOC101841231 isoform X1 [Mesocricetus auratus]